MKMTKKERKKLKSAYKTYLEFERDAFPESYNERLKKKREEKEPREIGSDLAMEYFDTLRKKLK